MTTIADLEELVKPLMRNAIKIEAFKSSVPPENSQLISHFGGDPYFEIGQQWPKTKSGKDLEFIFQVFNNQKNNLPENIKLVQFFYNWDEFPWDTEQDGWLVKIYENLNVEQINRKKNPNASGTVKYCEILFKEIQSLPDWDGLESYSEEAAKLACLLDDDQPWDKYQLVTEKLIGEQNTQSQIGGYPSWVQGDSTPTQINGEPMNLLFQLDSEENAELMWGDCGLIYVFYDETDQRIEFNLQCF